MATLRKISATAKRLCERGRSLLYVDAIHLTRDISTSAESRPLTSLPPSPQPKYLHGHRGDPSSAGLLAPSTFQKHPQQPFIRAEVLATRLAGRVPDWVDGTVTHLAAGYTPVTACSLTTELVRILADGGGCQDLCEPR